MEADGMKEKSPQNGRRQFLTPQVYLTVAAYLAVSWIYVLHQMKAEYVDNPASNKLVLLSVLHYVVFLAILLVLFLIYLETRLNLTPQKRLSYSHEYLYAMISTRWLHFFVYTLVCYALLNIELKDSLATNSLIVVLFVLISVAMYFLLTFSGDFRRKQSWLKLLSKLPFLGAAVLIYFFYVFACSIIFTNVRIDVKDELSSSNDVRLEISEEGYFLRAEVIELTVNGFYKVKIHGANTRNECVISFREKKPEGTYVTIVYLRQPFNILSEKTMFLKGDVSLSGILQIVAAVPLGAN
jgi:hypothetical protein